MKTKNQKKPKIPIAEIKALRHYVNADVVTRNAKGKPTGMWAAVIAKVDEWLATQKDSSDKSNPK